MKIRGGLNTRKAGLAPGLSTMRFLSLRQGVRSAARNRKGWMPRAAAKPLCRQTERFLRSGANLTTALWGMARRIIIHSTKAGRSQFSWRGKCSARRSPAFWMPWMTPWLNSDLTPIYRTNRWRQLQKAAWFGIGSMDPAHPFNRNVPAVRGRHRIP